MNKFRLERNFELSPNVNPWLPDSNDLVSSLIVEAESELVARELAQKLHGSEQLSPKLKFSSGEILVWQSPLFTTCEQL